MDYRKIIEFGKSSYVISLPKGWLKDHNLKKGDVIYVDQEEEKLNLYPQERYKKKNFKKGEIDITDLDPIQIKFLLVSKYVKNYNQITISGKNFSKKAKVVRDVIHDLIALEIIEETSGKIVTKDFLNMDDIDLIDTLKKMHYLTREMLKDTQKSFDEKNSDSLKNRDKDVNRLSYLVSRTIRYLQRRPALAKEQGFSQGALTRLWNLSLRVESIGDHTKRLATMMNRVKLSNPEKKELLKILNSVEKYYIDTIEAYFAQEKDKAVLLRPQANKLTKKCKDYFRANWDIDWVPTMLEKLKGILAETKQIAAYLCDQT
ncbi:AbrB/MazE/SpoVT family DNA-binding domain-containing protein [Nanoarchaeota archaeon]